MASGVEQKYKYYAMIDGEQRGPFDLEQLGEAGVRPSTYIWRKGMTDWQKAEDDADVCRYFRNRLYDIMHPVSSPAPIVNETSNIQSNNPNPSPSRFDYYLKDTGEQLPSLDEIDSRQNTEVPPVSMIGYAWLVTFLCFPPTGIVALIYAYKSKASWKAGEHSLAHDYSRSAKMMTGISFFLGLILYSFLIAFI